MFSECWKGGSLQTGRCHAGHDINDTDLFQGPPHERENNDLLGVLRLRFQRLYRLTYCLAKKEFSRGLCDHKGWDGEGDGREVQKGGAICVPMADSC